MHAVLEHLGLRTAPGPENSEGQAPVDLHDYPVARHSEWEREKSSPVPIPCCYLSSQRLSRPVTLPW